MKKKNFYALIMAILMGTASAIKVADAKTLVAYFSLTGNTKNAAEIVAKETNADLYEIELVTPYPSEYKAYDNTEEVPLEESPAEDAPQDPETAAE